MDIESIPTLKHPNKCKRKYTHHLATYPLSWDKYYISPTKICIHFADVQCKTRVKTDPVTDLKKTTWGAWEMPICTHGTDVGLLAVGIPLRLYPEVLEALLKAFKEHSILYPEYSLKDYLLGYADKIKETFT